MEKREKFLASNIKYLRKMNHKTQQELANICDKKNTAISNWEKGIREPDSIDLGVLSQLFNVSVDDLIFKNLKLYYSVKKIFDEELNLKVVSDKQDKIITETENFSEQELDEVLEYIDFLKSKRS